jgi:PTS system fructose-specific IIC component
MRITDYLDTQSIMLDLPARSKSETLAMITTRLAENKRIDDAAEFMAGLHRREGQGCTAIGHGVAIPHARSKTLERIVVAMARLRSGVDFGAEDGVPVRLVFLLGTPEEKAGEYLKVLGRLSKLLRENGLRERILDASDPDRVLELIEKAETELL